MIGIFGKACGGVGLLLALSACDNNAETSTFRYTFQKNGVSENRWQAGDFVVAVNGQPSACPEGLIPFFQTVTLREAVTERQAGEMMPVFGCQSASMVTLSIETKPVPPADTGEPMLEQDMLRLVAAQHIYWQNGSFDTLVLSQPLPGRVESCPTDMRPFRFQVSATYQQRDDKDAVIATRDATAFAFGCSDVGLEFGALKARLVNEDKQGYPTPALFSAPAAL